MIGCGSLGDPALQVLRMSIRQRFRMDPHGRHFGRQWRRHRLAVADDVRLLDDRQERMGQPVLGVAARGATCGLIRRLRAAIPLDPRIRADRRSGPR